MIKKYLKPIPKQVSWAHLRLVLEYGLPLILLTVLLFKIIGGTLLGDVPRPQIPPNGYLAQENRVTLHWSRGDHEGPFNLQVLVDGDEFDNAPGHRLIVDRTLSQTKYQLPQLQPGKEYCWRVIKDDGIIYCFKTSNSLITY